MMKLVYRTIFIGSIFLFFLSCSPGEATKPTYILIDAMHVQTDFAEEGTAHHDINTVWININGKSVGAFELPAIIPAILREGSNSLRLEAGINTNGIRSFRAINASFEPINLDLNYNSTGVEPDSITIEPSSLILTYRDGYNLVIVEDFDSPGLNFQRTNFSDTNFVKEEEADSIFNYIPFGSSIAEPNANSGLIVLDDLNPNVELSSVVSYTIEAGAQNIYLELSYRTNAEVGFGLIANYPSGDQSDITAVVLPKSEWNKIYINLLSEFQAFPGAESYQLLIRARKPSNLSEARIYLDNIKLVYPK